MSANAPLDNPATASRTARLFGYARKYTSLYAAGAVFLVLTNLASLAIPEQLGNAVQMMRDVGADDLASVRGDVIDVAVLIILLAVGAGVARIFSRITIFNAGRFVEFDLRNEVYEKLTSLTPSFYSGIATGDLTSRVANDVSHVRTLFAIPYLHLINATLAYGIALRKMVALDWSLTLWCLAPYPVLLLFVGRLIKAMFEQTKVVQAHLSTVSARVQENLAGVAVVKTYAMQPGEKSRFGDLNEEYVEKNMRLVTLRGGMNAVMSLMAGTGTFIVLLVGVGRVVDGQMALGSFVEFNGYVVALAFPTIAMGWVFSIWHRGLAAFDRVSEVLQTEPAIEDPSDATKLEVSLEGATITLDDVTFGYEPDAPILHGISLEIPSGSTVAFVGKTGAGKTTLLKLLSRFYEPDSGEVRVNGKPLDQLQIRDTRSQFGIVPQGPFLFSMTVGNNLTFGLDSLEHDSTLDRALPDTSLIEPGTPRTTAERVEEALDIAGLGRDIDGFPKGLGTLVGERGITLSGGQKQRVTIARALLMNPRVLVLDDALSSVDTKTEATILDHLETVMSGRTSILVTHRFNSLHRVDHIFVLEQGRLIEDGSHEALLERGGKYAAMYARQQLAEELEDE